MRLSVFCRVIAFRSFRPTSYRDIFFLRGTRQISLGKFNRLRIQLVANTNVLPDAFWASLLEASSPSTMALRRFIFIRVGYTPMTSTGPSLAGLFPRHAGSLP